MNEKLVSEHYESGRLLGLILEGLKAAGKDVDHLAVGDFAPVDEFHIRGRVSTVELATKAGLAPGLRVLDVGCGIGGSARYLASEWGVSVSGVDLTQEFVTTGQQINQMVDIDDSVALQVGTALELPFANESFDVVWTEHVQMNVEDKQGFYSEMARVLRPGGKLVFHDVFEGEGGPIHFPVPWAETESISFLVEGDAVRNLIANLGFDELTWDDLTVESNMWFIEMLRKLEESGPRPFGLHLILGENAKLKFGNLQRNLGERRVGVVQAVFRKGFKV